MAKSCVLILLSVLVAFSEFLPVFGLPTISAVGSKFFTSEGDQFFIKGIAYQLIPEDPLVDTKQCQLDANLMEELGANAIRVYHVDPDADHEGCMQAFADAGIYLFVDLDTFETYIQMDTISWTQAKFDAYRAVMDEFQQFDNTAGFFVGNEVLNLLGDAPAAPFLLAATKDLRAYGESQGYRSIPIGYSATDTAVLRPYLQDYLACRPNASEQLDFFALNSYEWCGTDTSFEISGYQALEESFQGYPIPLFFSETGCNTVPPRDFADQEAIFGPEMSDTWSGAIIYEWIQEVNDYGLISYGPQAQGADDGTSVVQGFVREGTPTPIAPDFSNLQSQWAKVTPSGTPLSAYDPETVSPRSCPGSTEGGWAVDPSQPLPTLGAEVVAESGSRPTNAVLPAVSEATDAIATAATNSEADSVEQTSGSAIELFDKTSEEGSASPSPASDDARQNGPNFLVLKDGNISGSMLALLTTGLAAVLFL